MGIYIDRMEMPTRCCECLLAKLSPAGESIYCNYSLSTVPWDERPFDCPLVPVPDHGRLIDADALPFVVSENGCQDDYVFRYDINEMPTIIPEEEGE